MKPIILALAFLLLLSSGAMAPSAVAFPAGNTSPGFLEMKHKTGVIKKSAEFWTGPPHLESSMVFLKLGAGTEVEILGREAVYLKVMHRNLIGYVEKRLVRVLTAEQEKAVPSPKSMAAKAEKKETVEAAVYGLHTVTRETSLRAAAEAQARVYVRLKEGYRVEVLENSGRWWWKVRYKDRVGWAKRALLKKE